MNAKTALIAIAFILLSANAAAACNEIQVYNQDWGVGDQAVIWGRGGAVLHAQGQSHDDYVYWNSNIDIAVYAGEGVRYEAAGGSGQLYIQYLNSQKSLEEEYLFKGTAEELAQFPEDGYIRFPNGTLAWEYNRLLLLTEDCFPKPDSDGDGYNADEDCDDGDASVHPGAPELCDGIDNDCDSLIDEGCPVYITCYRDEDNDFYTSGQTIEAVSCYGSYYPESHFVSTTILDLDDKDPDTYPGAPELCDGIDNDGDSQVDEGCPEPEPERPSFRPIPAQNIEMDSQEKYHLFDLWNYAKDLDNEKYELAFEVVNQTDSDLINCFVRNGHYIGCDAPGQGETGTNTVTVRVEDPDLQEGFESFDVSVYDPGHQGDGDDDDGDGDDDDGDGHSQQGQKIRVSSSQGYVYLNKTDSIGLRLRVENTSSERQCIDFEADTSSGYIEARLAEDHICLNRQEYTYVTLTIKTENASSRSYTATFIAETSLETVELDIGVRVSGESEIELVAYPTDVCRGEQEYLNVLVRNNSDEFKEVELQAENEMLLPYFEDDEISLGPNQEKYVKMHVHPSPYSSLGDQEVSMFAVTSHETTKETVDLDIVDCEGLEEDKEFRVRVASGCFEVEKGIEERIYFTVENLAEEGQTIYFSAGGELSAKMGQHKAFIEDGEEERFYFTVEVSEEAKVKNYDVTLHVWNSENSVEKEICIRPEKAHAGFVEIEQNDLVIRQCQNAVFTALVRNSGDYDEDIEVELHNNYHDIDATVSDSSFELEGHSSKEIYVNVSVAPDAALGDYTLLLEVKTGSETFTEELRFSVLEEEQADLDTSLEITGHSTSITMQEGQEKKLFLSVKNTGEKALYGIAIVLYGLPKGIDAESKTGISLQPGEEKDFELNIKADLNTFGEHDLVLQAISGNVSDEKQVKLVVEEASQSFWSGLVGLFTLGNLAWLGLIVLIVIVILALVARAASPQQKEIWMRG
jgi:uncharacterized membrane protein